MKEHPILFNDEKEVRAILQDYKTQARRFNGLENINKNPGDWEYGGVNKFDQHIFYNDDENTDGGLIKCPYGVPGDQLWVKEPFRVYSDLDGYQDMWRVGLAMGAEGTDRINHKDIYMIRRVARSRFDGDIAGVTDYKENPNSEDIWGQWRHPGQMCKWGSRLDLEVTGMKVERLQDISEADCKAEGVVQINRHFLMDPERLKCPVQHFIKDTASNIDWKLMDETYWGNYNIKVAFQSYIHGLYGPACWEKSPWVWVPEFKLVWE